MDNLVTYEGGDLEAMANSPGYVGWILDKFRPYLAGRTLEVGAGIGTISTYLFEEVSSLDLIEPSFSLVEKLNRRFMNNELVTVIPVTLEKYLADSEREIYNTVVMVNVLEHIKDDNGALGILRDLIVPGGCLLLYVPALPFLYSNFDKSVGHYRRYTRSNLTRQLEAAGYTIKYVSYFDFLGIFPWYIVNKLGGKTSLNPNSIKLYDKIGVPLARISESIIPPPIGKNIILIAQKPLKNVSDSE